jgi:methyltransferase (TIGR00027 family)
MTQVEPLIRNVSDTARWVAFYRAEESSRPDAVFNDPYARRLAGERGEQIARSGPFTGRNSWPFVARTYLFDRFIQEQIRQGADMIVNLAAGLDARPYRMALPARLRWIEVDLPEILAHKEQILDGEKPVCVLERLRLDLSDVTARRRLFQDLGRKATRALIVSEGLLTYLTEEEVGALAQDLTAPRSFHRWLLDFGSPALVKMLQKRLGQQMSQAPLKFAPDKGPEFFTPHGWKLLKADSVFKTAGQLKRLPLWMRLFALLPDSGEFKANRPWSAACLFERR